MGKLVSRILAASLMIAGAGILPPEKQEKIKTKYDFEALEKAEAKRERKAARKQNLTRSSNYSSL